MRETMNAREAAEYLGVSKDTMYLMARNGEIYHFRPRSRVMFRRSSLDRWMDEQEAQSMKTNDPS